MIGLGWMVSALLVAAPPVAPAAPVMNEAALVQHIGESSRGPSRRALVAALSAYEQALRRGWVTRTGLLTLIDYTRPSSERRLWVIDLMEGRVLFHELVAHGRYSGDDRTTRFSNAPGSLMTSLGLFVTDATYIGRNGYSLRLHGRTPGLNDNAFDRAIVVHGAPYVSASTVSKLGRLGRSWGCPAVPTGVARSLIDAIKGGTVMFAYGGPSAEPQLTN